MFLQFLNNIITDYDFGNELEASITMLSNIKLHLPLVKPGGTEVSVQEELTFVVSYIIHELDISMSCMVRTHDITTTM